jgi:hypothetical protein
MTTRASPGASVRQQSAQHGSSASWQFAQRHWPGATSTAAPSSVARHSMQPSQIGASRASEHVLQEHLALALALELDRDLFDGLPGGDWARLNRIIPSIPVNRVSRLSRLIRLALGFRITMRGFAAVSRWLTVWGEPLS